MKRFRRLLSIAFVAVLWLVCGEVQAGAVIMLAPDPLKEVYLPGETVRLNVLARFDTNPDNPYFALLRMVQFDLADTDPSLQLEPLWLPLHTSGEDTQIPFWDLRGAPVCARDQEQCAGVNHYVDGSLFGDPAMMLNLTYTELTQSYSDQIVMTQEGPTPMGSLLVTMPSTPGAYRVDFLNADEGDLNRGAEFRFGFGVYFYDPSVLWTARALYVTGGQYTFTVTPEPGTLLLLGAGCLLAARRRL